MTKSILLPLFLIGLVAAPGVVQGQSDPTKATAPAAKGPANPKGEGFRFALTGDSIINRRISVFQAPGFLELIERVRSADAAFTNFETVIHNFEYPGEALSGGTYMGSPAYITDEIKWMGFDLLGTANNHTFDFGVQGMRSNIQHLQAAGLTFAGTGENLARARAPGYFDTGKGRVALISCASTFPPASAAGQQRPDLLGRPGLNPLRFTTTYVVNTATYKTIDTLASMTATGSVGFAGVEAPGGRAVTFLGTRFEEGAVTAIHTKPVAADLEGIAAAVRDARQQADWVIVSIHCHEGMPGKNEEPAEFYVTFAHAMIDAGADLLVGHGPHILRGIEVYKQKPIFYSLGNFVLKTTWSSSSPRRITISPAFPPRRCPATIIPNVPAAKPSASPSVRPIGKVSWQSRFSMRSGT